MAAQSTQRILYYSKSCGLHDLKFIDVLSKLSGSVLVVSRSGVSLPDELVGKVKFLSFANSDSKPPVSREAIKKLTEVHRTYIPKITVAGPLWPCAYEAAMAKVPNLIATSWAFDILIDARRSERIRRNIALALSSAQVLLFDSPWVTKEAYKINSFPKAKARVFPWGVDTSRFLPRSIGDTDAQETFEILHTRTLDKIYRPDVLIRALSIAIRKKPNFRLTAIAAGPLLAKMQTISKRLGVEKNIVWIPPVQNRELPVFLKKASVYTTAACSDGVSISLLEAMASGLPAIVPDLPSNIHLLSPRHRCQTFRLNDPQSMAEKWIAISELPRKARANVGAANRSKVEGFASLRSFQDNYSKIIFEHLND